MKYLIVLVLLLLSTSCTKKVDKKIVHDSFTSALNNVELEENKTDSNIEDFFSDSNKSLQYLEDNISDITNEIFLTRPSLHDKESDLSFVKKLRYFLANFIFLKQSNVNSSAFLSIENNLKNKIFKDCPLTDKYLENKILKKCKYLKTYNGISSSQTSLLLEIWTKEIEASIESLKLINDSKHNIEIAKLYSILFRNIHIAQYLGGNAQYNEEITRMAVVHNFDYLESLQTRLKFQEDDTFYITDKQLQVIAERQDVYFNRIIEFIGATRNEEFSNSYCQYLSSINPINVLNHQVLSDKKIEYNKYEKLLINFIDCFKGNRERLSTFIKEYMLNKNKKYSELSDIYKEKDLIDYLEIAKEKPENSKLQDLLKISNSTPDEFISLYIFENLFNKLIGTKVIEKLSDFITTNPLDLINKVDMFYKVTFSDLILKTFLDVNKELTVITDKSNVSVLSLGEVSNRTIGKWQLIWGSFSSKTTNLGNVALDLLDKISLSNLNSEQRTKFEDKKYDFIGRMSPASIKREIQLFVIQPLNYIISFFGKQDFMTDEFTSFNTGQLSNVKLTKESIKENPFSNDTTENIKFFNFTLSDFSLNREYRINSIYNLFSSGLLKNFPLQIIHSEKREELEQIFPQISDLPENSEEKNIINMLFVFLNDILTDSNNDSNVVSNVNDLEIYLKSIKNNNGIINSTCDSPENSPITIVDYTEAKHGLGITSTITNDDPYVKFIRDLAIDSKEKFSNQKKYLLKIQNTRLAVLLAKNSLSNNSMIDTFYTSLVDRKFKNYAKRAKLILDFKKTSNRSNCIDLFVKRQIYTNKILKTKFKENFEYSYFLMSIMNNLEKESSELNLFDWPLKNQNTDENVGSSPVDTISEKIIIKIDSAFNKLNIQDEELNNKFTEFNIKLKSDLVKIINGFENIQEELNSPENTYKFSISEFNTYANHIFTSIENLINFSISTHSLSEIKDVGFYLEYNNDKLITPVFELNNTGLYKQNEWNNLTRTIHYLNSTKISTLDFYKYIYGINSGAKIYLDKFKKGFLEASIFLNLGTRYTLPILITEESMEEATTNSSTVDNRTNINEINAKNMSDFIFSSFNKAKRINSLVFEESTLIGLLKNELNMNINLYQSGVNISNTSDFYICEKDSLTIIKPNKDFEQIMNELSDTNLHTSNECKSFTFPARYVIDSFLNYIQHFPLNDYKKMEDQLEVNLYHYGKSDTSSDERVKISGFYNETMDMLRIGSSIEKNPISELDNTALNEIGIQSINDPKNWRLFETLLSQNFVSTGNSPGSPTLATYRIEGSGSGADFTKFTKQQDEIRTNHHIIELNSDITDFLVKQSTYSTYQQLIHYNKFYSLIEEIEKLYPVAESNEGRNNINNETDLIINYMIDNHAELLSGEALIFEKNNQPIEIQLLIEEDSETMWRFFSVQRTDDKIELLVDKNEKYSSFHGYTESLITYIEDNECDFINFSLNSKLLTEDENNQFKALSLVSDINLTDETSNANMSSINSSFECTTENIKEWVNQLMSSDYFRYKNLENNE